MTYYVQGLYSDFTVSFEADYLEETEALEAAKDLVVSPMFEGQSVRVLSVDGEIVEYFTNNCNTLTKT